MKNVALQTPMTEYRLLFNLFLFLLVAIAAVSVIYNWPRKKITHFLNIHNCLDFWLTDTYLNQIEGKPPYTFLGQ